MHIDVAMRTDRGILREHNEDAVGGDPSAGLLILADGMGGANAGEVASQLAVDLLVSQLLPKPEQEEVNSPGSEAILGAMSGVNQAILELAQQVPEYQGMGTTVVLGQFHAQALTYAHVGDSRIYLWREGVLTCLTTDHTLIQEMVDMGDFATHDEAQLAGVPPNVLTRAFGAEPEVAVDLATCEVEEGDIYLFCSDGLTGMLTDQVIQTILQGAGEDLMEQTDELIELACSKGGVDNISVILARVKNTDE
jgi:protein phosphatase